MFAHLDWADQAVLGALAKTTGPSSEALELLAHILGAEHVWLARLEGRPPEVAVWPSLTLEECTRLARTNRRGFEEVLGREAPEALARPVRYRNSAGQEFVSTVEDILLHVCLHGAYHRGQIARAMRLGGAVPAPTDYIGFIRGVPAATRGSRG
jgi:uncharacterized damage-inducible protein DinB